MKGAIAVLAALAALATAAVAVENRYMPREETEKCFEGVHDRLDDMRDILELLLEKHM